KLNIFKVNIYICHKPEIQALRQIIKINQRSVLPKYQQIIDSLFQAVEKGFIKKGDKLPSINEIKSDFNISRDTVLYAYNELKTKGILVSLPGKGYYLATNDTHRDEKIFILFDELNSFRKEVYNSLVNSLQGSVRIE